MPVAVYPPQAVALVVGDYQVAAGQPHDSQRPPAGRVPRWRPLAVAGARDGVNPPLSEAL